MTVACGTCGAPAQPGHNPRCALCKHQLRNPAELEKLAEAAGEQHGLAGVFGVRVQGHRYVDLEADLGEFAGKCVMVKAGRGGGFSRCLAPANCTTDDGDECCEACWTARGGR